MFLVFFAAQIHGVFSPTLILVSVFHPFRFLPGDWLTVFEQVKSGAISKSRRNHEPAITSKRLGGEHSPALVYSDGTSNRLVVRGQPWRAEGHRGVTPDQCGVFLQCADVPGNDIDEEG